MNTSLKATAFAILAAAPFLGVAFGMLLFRERPGIQFYIGLIIMVLATILLIKDTLEN